MKVSDIISRVRNIAGDSEVLQFTDAMLIDWINDGIRDCAIQNTLLQKSANSNTAVGVDAYPVPSDILRLHSVIVDGSKLNSLTLQEWQARSGSKEDSGKPTAFYIWANKVHLSPTPGGSYPLVLHYTYNPQSLLNSSDAEIAQSRELTPALPVQYHSRLVDYCLAQVAQQDGDNNLYAIKMQEFSTGVQQLKDKPEYNEDLYPSISVSNRDAGWDDGYF